MTTRRRRQLESVITSGRKGQDFISRKLSLLERGESSILTPEYRAKQQADYDKYQTLIEQAQAELAAN